jgi:hypothetical protein
VLDHCPTTMMTSSSSSPSSLQQHHQFTRSLFTSPPQLSREGSGPSATATRNVTFKAPRVESLVLDYCLADDQGTLGSCGKAAAEPYCVRSAPIPKH